MKKRIFDIIQISNTSDKPSAIFDVILVIMIFANITVMFAETFDVLQPCSRVFDVIEVITLTFFAAEYALRLWTAEYLYPDLDRRHAMIRFIFSFDGMVCLLTILPFYFLSGFVAFRMLRVVRILHLFRINASTDSFNVIVSVIFEKKNQILSSLFIIQILMMASSLCMYSAEHDAQPEVFANAFSGIWWSAATVLTVGYGDIYPVTLVGKIMGIVIAFLGTGAVAVPTGIISAGFVEQYTKVTGTDDPFAASLQNLVIDIDSAWLGLTARQVEERYQEAILLVRRNEVTFRPGVEYNVSAGDVIQVYTQGNRRKG
ncbi:MAG: ion transporter [Solobacterium sp.]|nr:ion transporter [Solobacterium sp.]